MYLSELKIWNFRKYGEKENGEPGLNVIFHEHFNVISKLPKEVYRAKGILHFTDSNETNLHFFQYAYHAAARG